MDGRSLSSGITYERPACVEKALDDAGKFIAVMAAHYMRNAGRIRGRAVLDVEDLKQIGRLAVYQAYDAFDHRKQDDLWWSAFITMRVKAAMIDELRHHYGRTGSKRVRFRTTEMLKNHEPTVDGRPFTKDQGILSSDTLAELMASELNERERWVLGMHFFWDQSGEEIAEMEGVSDSRISQIKSGALEKLRLAAEELGDSILELR